MGSDVQTLITEHIDLWASAIERKKSVGRGSSKKHNLYGIKKLRELILELAVRGKLVPQAPNDEPASVLLERIADERDRLVKEKKIKKPKKLAEVSEAEKLFDLPVGWEWCKLAEVAYINGGFAFKSSQYVDDGTRVIRISDFDESGLKNDKVVRYQYGHELESYLIEPQDILMAMTGGTVGKCLLVSSLLEQMLVNQRVACIRSSRELLPDYIAVVIKTQLVQSVIEKAKNSTNDNISMRDINNFILPVPPITEQQRIVIKVDELMALCDQLEAQTENNITAHQQLVETLLATLTQSQNADELAENWQRLAEHFDTLFTTEHSIDQLKQTILQLAVMGKLVSQDPNDEPASVLLERIATEKEQLIKEKKIKKQKALPPISEGEKPFALPEGWEWSRLPDIGELARGKSKHRPRNDPKLYSEGKTPLVQTGDVSRSNGTIDTYTALYNEDGVAQSRLWPAGTMCITIAANIADTGILSFDACFPDSVVGFIPYIQRINVRYFEYFIRTVKGNLEAFAPSTAQKNINLEILSQLMVPLPPQDELNRVVTKVDQLMIFCDQLKTRLHDAQQNQLKLADAIGNRMFGYHSSISKETTKAESEMKISTQLSLGDVQPDDSAIIAVMLKASDEALDAKDVWKKSDLDLPDFYQQLKKEIAAGFIAKPTKADFIQE